MGLKVPVSDRADYFDRSWTNVILSFPTGTAFGEIEVNVDKPSFWNNQCHELISMRIKDWLCGLGLVPWADGHPPKVLIEPLGERKFAILGVDAKKDGVFH